MAKTQVLFVCTKCDAQYPKWKGQCAECGAWNTLEEQVNQPAASQAAPPVGYAGATAELTKMQDVELSETPRMTTESSELDRVLGGGLVPGSVVLVGGDPGVGKSTLLLQTLCLLGESVNALYVTGEESLSQVTMRAKRLKLPAEELQLLCETKVESVIAMATAHKPKVIVIDSIQTMFTELLSSAPGSVSQLRESAAQLVRFAKQTDTAILLIGHVTKEGSLAGPRALEHMVDTVLYFENQQDNRFRVLRAVKNRFGTVNELGLFMMDERGLKPVNNPSAIFLQRNPRPVSGSVVMVTWEGSRPILIEVQALVAETSLGNPRRVSVGGEQNRLAMLLAVLHRHGGIFTSDHDVFINIVGGVKVSETALDLALLCSVLSSLRDKILPQELIVFGEVGLSGEIRPVQRGQERLYEAAKHGFKRAIVPKLNVPKNLNSDLHVIPVEHLSEVLEQL